ncbi:MAG: cobyric acid synthase [Victivallales bacterium]|nr:cobyric acid synthase [Victivallales bacterium]
MIEHGGNLKAAAEAASCRADELLDFSVNLNPAGVPEGLLAACFHALNEISPYPEIHADSLPPLAAEKWGGHADNYLFANGSSELLALIPRVWECARAIVLTPGYLEYAESFRKSSVPVHEFALREENNFHPDLKELSDFLQPGDMLIMGNPNNPSGVTLPASELHQFILSCPDVKFLIDEAFADFSGETLLDFELPDNLLILRSMTKFHSIAGLRLGFAVANPQLIAALREAQICWAVNIVAIHAAEFLLRRRNESAQLNTELRRELAEQLTAAGYKVYPSQANYLLLKTPVPMYERLLKQKILVRDCSNYPGLDARFIRVAVRKREDNARLLQALAPQAPALHIRLAKPALMLQGTCSNAGKSILTAAFCRIMLQDGFAVAPFKAQNMALNSYVTPDGGEIGRAQAVQAEACRLDPDVRMNPILLKPNSDLGSQVILHGKAIGNYRVRDYFRKKAELWAEVKKSYDSLSAEYDCIVLEGAGSPGEVNLKSTDLVNMRMAQYARAQVLLAGDIDRGGVYAAFVGTYATLEPWERELLYGFVVNKFRGDPTLLGDAHDYVKNMTGKPVLGVIDYQHDIGLPEEDSVNFAFTRPVRKDAQTLDVVVIHLGHIANFTDFAPFEVEPDVRVRIVRSAEDFGEPDVIIIPGSKGVADDLIHLREKGLDKKLLSSKAFIVGICGGLQILGSRLLDPDGVESNVTALECLNMLPLTTVMLRDKTLCRTVLRHPDGNALSGYEIHHGQTVADDETLFTISDTQGKMLVCERGRIFATYLHGVFDDDRFRRDYLNKIRAAKGWQPLLATTEYGIENALNSLADHVRERIDIQQLYRKMGLR